jgi:hypothetical protein
VGSINSGGAIYINDLCNISISEVFFESCYSGGHGSGIMMNESNTEESIRNLSLTNCIFKYCESGNGGQGILKLGHSITVIDECLFEYCSSGNNGGVIYNFGWGSITIKNSNFINDSSKYGGAYFSDNSEKDKINFIIFECTNFTNCFSMNCGGALGIGGARYITICECFFLNCTTINNGIFFILT